MHDFTFRVSGLQYSIIPLTSAEMTVSNTELYYENEQEDDERETARFAKLKPVTGEFGESFARERWFRERGRRRFIDT